MTLHEDPTYACDTKNPAIIKIENLKDLASKVGQFYEVGERKFRLVVEGDNHLVGKTLRFRSPATCASTNGKICKACYGHLYNVNMNVHAGIYASLESNESKTQSGLSAKHVLATASSYIEMHDLMNFFTTPNGWSFHLNSAIDLSRYKLVISPSEVSIIDADNYDKYDNYTVGKFVFKDKETGERFEVYDDQNSQMYMGKQLFDYLKENKRFFSLEPDEVIEVSLSKFDTKESFSYIQIKNSELTKAVKELASFIQKGKKQFEDVKNYSEFIVKLNKLYSSSAMTIPSVHIEMILRNLIRDKKNPRLIPDWSVEQKPGDYVMVSLNSAVTLSNSVLLGLMFERVKGQLKDPMTFEKDGTSLYSPLFINE